MASLTPAPARKTAPAKAQRDLFQFNSPLIRGERSLMAFPFFALAK